MSGLNVHLYPSALANDSRLLRMARGLQKTGLFRETHVVGKYGKGSPAVEEVATAVFKVRLPSRSLAPGLLGKVLSTINWYRVCYRAYARRECSSIAAHTVWVLPLAYLLARRSGSALFYNPHEYESGTPSVSAPVRIVARLVEKWFIPLCDGFSVVNQSIAERYRSDLPTSNPIVVRNLPSLLDGEDGVDLRSVCDVPEDALLFVHTGNLVDGRSLPSILSSFSSADLSAHIVFVGEGPLRGLVDAAVNSCPRIHRVPPVTERQVVQTVASADVALCLVEANSESYRMSSPNKFFEGMAAGIPVLCSDLVEVRRVYGELAVDWVVDDVGTDLTGAIRSIDSHRMAEFRKHMPVLGSWESEVVKLVGSYRAAVSELSS